MAKAILRTIATMGLCCLVCCRTPSGQTNGSKALASSSDVPSPCIDAAATVAAAALLDATGNTSTMQRYTLVDSSPGRFNFLLDMQLPDGLPPKQVSVTALQRANGSCISSGWHQLKDAPFPPIEDHAVAALHEKIYVIGGFRTEMYVYDTITETWARLADVPAPMGIHHPNVAAVGERLYIVGTLMRRGGDPRTEATSGAVWIYDPKSDTWSNGTAMPDSQKWRGAAATMAIGTKIYVAGGYKGRLSSTAMSDFQVYDTASDTWSTLPDLPVGRDHVMGAALGKLLAVVGGEDSSQVYNRLDIFDPSAGTWRTGAPMPTGRAGSGAGVFDGVLIIAGGDDENAGSARVFAATESYDVSTNKWTSYRNMPNPRQGVMGLSGIGPFLYFVGGSAIIGAGFSTEVDVFIPPPKFN